MGYCVAAAMPLSSKQQLVAIRSAVSSLVVAVTEKLIPCKKCRMFGTSVVCSAEVDVHTNKNTCLTNVLQL